jgi:vancomycin aglycone glucosyltransferase
MRVLLSTYGGRGDVEPMVGLAVRLRALGAEVRVCAPPDWAERLAQFGVPLVPNGPPVRQMMHGVTVRRPQHHLTPETRARAAAVAGTIRADGATVAAKLLLNPSAATSDWS